MHLMFMALVFISYSPPVDALYDGMYCGKENCYDVLGVSKDDSKGDIAKAYRKLARVWHPDMHQGAEAKQKAEKEFQRVATAYEILRDADSRSDYDYMLDNPDEFYYHYYRYYYRRVSPKVDVRIVIAVTISVISACQYYVAWSNYTSAINYLIQVPKHRMRAMDIARKEKLIEIDKKKLRGKSKSEIREEEEAVLKKILQEKMDIRGGYRRPRWTDVLWVRLIIFPYTLAVYIKWYATWVWRFDINKEDYGEEEKLYLIKKYMKCNETQWESVDDEQREEYLRLELWKKEEFDVYKAEQEAEMKAKLAQSSRYKSIRRYIKNNKQQMTFGPE
ncbi:dnaJ homolog subfamily C member 25 homolog [Watersipora subatra]|uniref:dnaJ homolog subfamily C member 25 homolog n=1 Tax=Watersipora subatra TaxID=2589382 RepID=UPI00355B2767